MTFHHILGAAALAMLTPATMASAQNADTLPILFCKPAQGCWQGKSHVTAEELRVLLGDDLVPLKVSPETHSIVYTDGSNSPAVSDIPAESINRLYGGTDVLQQIWLANPGGGSRPTDAVTPEELGISPALMLFYPKDGSGGESTADLVPLDGLWTAIPRDFTFKACNPALEQALGGALAGMKTEESRNITWDGRFDPHKFDFVNGDNQSVEWTRMGPNKYTGTLFEVAEDGANLFSNLTLTLISERLIDATSLLNIRSLLNGVGEAEMASLGFLDCEITMHFDLTHMGE